MVPVPWKRRSLRTAPITPTSPAHRTEREPDRDLQEHLISAKAEGAARHQRIQRVAGVLALVLGLLVAVAIFVPSFAELPDHLAAYNLAISSSVIPAIPSILLLSLTTSKPGWSRKVVIVVACIFGFSVIAKILGELPLFSHGWRLHQHSSASDHHEFCGSRPRSECDAALVVLCVTHFVTNIAMFFACGFIFRLVYRQAPTVVLIERVWQYGSGVALVSCVTSVCQLLIRGLWLRSLNVNSSFEMTSFNCFAMLITAVFSSQPRLRARVQALFASIGGEISSAVAISALLGQLSPQQVLEDAGARFRSVPASVVIADLQRPCRLAHYETRAASLGAVDAFVSHSWWDDPHSKAAAMTQWANRFQAKHGREAIVWFDRACLDPGDLARSLACLPVFIAGCRGLVVLRGPTMLSRLWCIVELFTFLAMGGSADQVEVIRFGQAAQLEGVQPTLAGASRADVLRSYGDGRFDARRAVCSVAADQQLLVTVLEAYPTGIDKFNEELLVALIAGERRWNAWVPTHALGRGRVSPDASKSDRKHRVARTVGAAL